ncbi:MAG TPA: VWA domain-containing protein [Phycisphaerae bacterium]|nr:VWA domain-containing protein [Phycisphaerae bacterium]HNU44850.1 VWA domain-containing protein [Phycisphaerae bacterium]
MKQRSVYPLSVFVAWGLLVPTGLVAAALALFLLTDVGKLPLDQPHLWWVVGIVPLVGALYVYGAWRRRRALLALTSAPLAAALTPGASALRQAVRAGAVGSAILLLAIALTGPRWGIYMEKQRAFGIDVVVAVDVSRSMLARDLAPNRLEHTKDLIRSQLTERSTLQQGSRLGLLAFAGSASMKVPLTLDHGFFRQAVDTLHVGSAPRGGTAIAEAIYEASEFFAASPPEATKLILVFTDGEDHEGEAEKAAKEVFDEHGIKVFTIGVGDPLSPAGAEVPSDAEPGSRSLVYNGQIVFSRLNEDYLRNLAQAGGQGIYARLADLPRVVDALAGMQRHQLTTEERQRSKPRYQWFVAGALLLLTLEMFIHERRRNATGGALRVWSAAGTGEQA